MVQGSEGVRELRVGKGAIVGKGVRGVEWTIAEEVGGGG